MFSRIATIIPYLKRYRRYLMAGLVAVAAHNILRLVAPMVLRRAVDQLREGISTSAIWSYVGLIVGLANPRITDEAVHAAAREVGAHTFIERLPDGYNHVIGERGTGLSFGEKQLLAFARTLAFDPPLLILDEATSSVDTGVELLIQRALARLLTGRTAIVIAHRLSTIRAVDRIIVLHKGRVREMGTHEELLRQKGIYYRLYLLQYKDQESGMRELSR